MSSFQPPPFHPFFRSGHLATLAGNFWRRPVSEDRWPVTDILFEPEAGARVLIRRQSPEDPRGSVILVHGLEGSSESGYMRSMAHALLEADLSVDRYNMRGCGGSPWSPAANYHSGQTGDLKVLLAQRRQASTQPIFLVGYSLGGNQVLKLAAELGEQGGELLDGVCSVCAPIDLAASVRQTAAQENVLYQRRFVGRLKDRVRSRNPLSPDLFPLEHLPKVRSIWDFDDYYTSQIFGFGTAANYYRTQSANQFLNQIRIPALLIHAEDDPMIPAVMYDHPAFLENPWLQRLTMKHGGHLGFIARQGPRFWLDQAITRWIEERLKA